MRIWKVLILLSVLTISACKDSPSSLGDEFIPNSDKYTFYQVETAAIKDSTYYNEPIPSIKTYTEDIVIGKLGDYESCGLMKFPLNAADSIKTMLKDGTITISKAWITMVSHYYAGDKNGNFDFTMQKITNSIDYYKITSSTFPNVTYDGTDISNSKTSTDSLTSFGIDTKTVYDWIMRNSSDSLSYPNNYGVILKPKGSTNKIMGFLGTANSLGVGPKLFFEFKKGTVYTDTLAAMTTISTYYATKPAPSQTDQYIYLNGTVTYKNKIQFKLPVLPTNAVMNKVTLDLYMVDSTDVAHRSLTSYSELGNMVTIGYVTSANSTTIDSTTAMYLYRLASPNRPIYRGDITEYAQRWINNGTNYGMVLSVYNDVYDASKYVFCGSNHSNAALRPKLKITYSLRNKD